MNKELLLTKQKLVETEEEKQKQEEETAQVTPLIHVGNGTGTTLLCTEHLNIVYLKKKTKELLRKIRQLNSQP